MSDGRSSGRSDGAGLLRGLVPARERGRVSRRARGSVAGGIGMIAVVVILAMVPYAEGPGVTYQLASLFILVILASMWNLLAGYAGLVSIGLQGFIGLGSYALLWLSLHGVPAYPAIPLAALIGAVIAIPTAFLAFRLRGGYFAVGTWVISEVFLLVISQQTSLGAGSGASLTSLSGYDPAQRQADTYWAALVVLVAALGGIYLLLRSRLGLGLTAIRDSEDAASSLGVGVTRGKLAAYLLAALGCSAAGALMLVNSLRVAPGSAFSVQWSAEMIFCVMVGGLGTIEGPVIGAVIFWALQYWLSSHGVWYLILVGAIAIVMVVRFRQGLWGLLAARTRIGLFPIGYRVDMTAMTASQPLTASPPSEAPPGAEETMTETGAAAGATAEPVPPAAPADLRDGVGD